MRLFSTEVGAIVGKERVFGADSECLDDGPAEIERLLGSINQIVREFLRIERIEASASADDKAWNVGFFTSTASRRWETALVPRDYGAIFKLVNEALHH